MTHVTIKIVYTFLLYITHNVQIIRGSSTVESDKMIERNKYLLYQSAKYILKPKII